MSDRKRACAGRGAHGSRPRILLPFIVLLLMAPAWAHAYVMAMSLQELANRADLIVHGTVADIVTSSRGVDVTVRIQQLIKGDVRGTSLTVHYPSGLEDTPQFTADETVLLFLSPMKDGTWQVIGGMQGKATLGAEK